MQASPAAPVPEAALSHPVLVVGLGNPVLGDDGVGWHVVDEVERTLAGRAGAIETDRLGLGGLALMERLVNHERVILVDAVPTGHWPTGTVRRLLLDDLPDPLAGHTSSPHDVSLACALRLGRTLGVALPRVVEVVAVEAPATFEFSDRLSPAVAAAVPEAARAVMDALGSDQPVAAPGEEG